jgi:hypothetical protein
LTLVSTVEHGLSERLASRVDGHLATFAEHMREGLLAASTAVGLEVLAELMDAEVCALVGPKGKHDADRTTVRHGTEAGSVTLGGRRVRVVGALGVTFDGTKVPLGVVEGSTENAAVCTRPGVRPRRPRPGRHPRGAVRRRWRQGHRQGRRRRLRHPRRDAAMPTAPGTNCAL